MAEKKRSGAGLNPGYFVKQNQIKNKRKEASEKKLTREESIVKEKKEDKLRGVTTKPGLLQNNLKSNVKRQESIKRGRLKAGGMAQKGLGKAFKKGGRA